MKKFFALFMAVWVVISLTTCEYDDKELWQEVDSLNEQLNTLNSEVATLKVLLDALNKGKVITNVQQDEDGYTLTFNDGKTVSIKHGKDGEKGEDGADGDTQFVSVKIEGDRVVITMADGTNIVLPLEYTYSEIRVLTFEDKDYKGTSTNYWSSMIPSDQKGGGHSTYSWHDAGNTELSFSHQEGAFSGEAGVSNYFGSDLSIATGNASGYLYDLQAYNVSGGHSGTNFCTHFGYKEVDGTTVDGASLPFLEFADGEARVIDHMWVTNTTYVVAQLTDMSAFAGIPDYKLSESTIFKVVAYGYPDIDDEVSSTTAELYLLKNMNFVTEWTKWDLTGLGKVAKVQFNLVGSDDLYGQWGLGAPGYFAYDDIAVRF
jgi:hypothetical protein